MMHFWHRYVLSPLSSVFSATHARRQSIFPVTSSRSGTTLRSRCLSLQRSRELLGPARRPAAATDPAAGSQAIYTPVRR